MKRLLTLVFFSLLLTSLYADKIFTDEIICSTPGADYRDISQYESIASSNDADIYQWKPNGDVFLYAPKGYDYKLIVLYLRRYIYDENPKDFYINSNCWVVLGVIGSGVSVSIPAELEIMGFKHNVKYIEEGALSAVSKIVFEDFKNYKGWRVDQLIFNNKDIEAEFVINREMWFLEPLSSSGMKRVSFGKDLTVYPRGLYCDTEEELTIPSQFKKLPNYCFLNCKKLSIINLPETIESIGSQCFAGTGLSSLRLPYYLKEAGYNIIKETNITKVYLPWQPTGPCFKIAYGDLFLESFDNNNTTYYIPSNIEWGEYLDKVFSTRDYWEGIDKKISPCEYIYHWAGDSLSEIVVPNGIFTVVPELKDNELLVATPDAGVNQETNVIVAEKGGRYHASHLHVTDSHVNASATKFVLPFDTYCDTLSFVTDQTGYKAMKLSFAGISDLSNWVGHRYNNESSTYIPADTIDAGKFVLALRTSTGTQSTYLYKSDQGKGECIKATDKIIEISDADSKFKEYVVGYQHPTEMTFPQISETGDYSISSLGELYFFHNYAPYTQGNVTLMKDLYFPQKDYWTPIPSFSKTFDGNGHVISGINVIPFDKGNGGMFAQLNEGSVVKRLHLKGTVQGYEGESYNYVGGLVGLCYGHVTHCVIDMDVNISNCVASAIVIGSLSRAEYTPTYNVMLGRVFSPSRVSYDAHGLLIGKFGITYLNKTEEVLIELKKFIKDMRTNVAASSTYCKIGTIPANKYFCDPGNASQRINELIQLYTQYLPKNNVLDNSIIQNGGVAFGSEDTYELVQNVSSLMAPLDSVPYPASEHSNKLIVQRTPDNVQQDIFPYHNCINFTGGSVCPVCNRSAEAPKAIQIGTAEELRAFAKEVNASTTPQHWFACLTADIDLENVEWTPIGDNPDLKYDYFCEPDIHCDTLAFRGIFNGQGHTIRGLKVSGSDRNNRGLFGVLHDNALVCNLVIYGNVEGNVNVGSVAGLMSRSEVSSVISYVNVQGEKNTGGLVGAMVGNHAYLANSIYLGKVTAEMADDKANGRLVGAANTRFLKSWDIQSVKIKNVYAPLPPEDKDDLFEIGSGSVPNAYICTLDSIYFRNDSVNHAIKNEFYQNLLSALYHITGIDQQPTCEVEIEPVIPDTPDTPVTPGTDETDEPDEPPFVDECYEISNGKQLRCFANMVNSNQQTYKAKLIKDIDLKDEEWTPIGSGTKYFNGTFDGQGHIIRGLRISKSIPNVNYYGLFGTLNQGTVQNVMVYGKGIETSQNAGVIAGKATSSHVKNCLVDCPVTGTGKFDVGGIIGTMDKNTDVANCLVLSSVQNTSNTNLCGQIVGYAISCCVRNCLASGDGSVLGINAKRKVTTNGCETNLYDSIACGAVAYRLAGNTDIEDKASWGQTFGKDTIPTLGGKKVYCGTSDVDYDYCNIDTIQTGSDVDKWQFHFVAHRLTLDDTIDSLRLPADATTFKAFEIYHYRRDSRGFNSICLPVYLPTEALPEDYVLGYLSDAKAQNSQEVITFTTTQLLKENQPGIFFMADERKRRDKQDAKILLNANKHNQGMLYEIALENNEPSVTTNGVTLTGAYKKKLIKAGHYKINDDGVELLHTTAMSHVYPYHWYLTVGSPATRAIIGITPQTPDNESESETESEGETIYFDLSGRRINPDTHQGIRLSRDAKSVINK